MTGSANSDSKSSKRSLNSMSNSNRINNKKKRTNQKTLGMAWGSNSRSSSRSSFRSSPFSDFGSYMTAKNRKLQDQFEAEASTSSHGPSNSEKPLFNGVSIFVDGYTVPSSQELKGYMLKHGGRFENYFSRRRVTHIICSNLPDSKIKNLRSFSRGLPVVKPTWVLDSVAANKLLSWLPYQLEQLAKDTRHQPKLSAFFTPKGSSVSDDEATCTTNQSLEGGRTINSNLLEEGESTVHMPDQSLDCGRTMDSDLLEEGESTEHPKQYSEESDDFVRPNCSNMVEKSDVALVDQSLVGVQPEFCPSPPSASAISRCVDDKKTKESSNSTVLGPSNQRHSTLVDPNFVENYFKNSRLHFIGTWRNRYRKRFPNVSNGFKCLSSNPDPSSISQKATIIHLDMDCFFVSVVIRNHPELRDKPVAVCHSDNPRGTAEISSANYPARDHGIKAGIFVRDAKALCPHLFILPYNFEAYEEVADQFYDILHKHCDKVQAVSCDEAFVDVTNMDLEDPELFASIIRKEIFETTQCTASAGIAGNMLMARLATRTAKPDGQCYIHPDKVYDYLHELPIKALPGIGHVLEEKLKTRQVKTCGQLRTISKESLQKDFGSKTGVMLWNYSRGIDNRLVGMIQESKSVGADVNWGVRFNDLKDCQHFLMSLCKEVSLRLQGCGVQGRTFTLKVKKRRKDAGEPVKYMGCGACENLSHSTTVPVATDDVDVLLRITTQLFGYFHIDIKDIRGMGLQVSKLENADNANQGKNSIRSWLVSASASNREHCKISSPGKKSANRDFEEQQNNRNQGDPNSSISGTLLNRNSNLPPLHDLDMGVIASLPPELFSEFNDMYGGKLVSLISKNKGKNVLGIDSSCTTPSESFEGLRTEGKRPHPTSSREISIDEKFTSSGEVQVAQVSGAGPSNLAISDSAPERIDLMPCSLSQIDESVLQQLPEEVRIDVLEHFSAHRTTSECTTNDALGTTSMTYYKESLDVKPNGNPPGPSDSSRSNNDLWVGNPPKWVDEFEKSNYWILNIFAEMYYRTGSTAQLSYILLRTMSASQLPVGANTDDGWGEAICCFCEVIKQYFKLKIDTDIEEIYNCFSLLKRLAAKSTFLLQVYSTTLPELQAAVGEKYGGNFNIS